MKDHEIVNRLREPIRQALDSPLVFPMLENAIRHKDSNVLAQFMRSTVNAAGFDLSHFEEE